MTIGSRNLTATIAGFVGALGVFAILLWSIDTERFLAALNRIPPDLVGLMVGLAIGWLLVWSLSLRTVLGVLGIEVSIVQAFLLYASALFASNVTPLGQASGEPVAAAFLARASGAGYERGLASIVSVDAIHFIPSLTFALLGLAYYTTLVALGQYLLLAALVVVGLASVIPVVLGLAWRYRYTLEQRLITALMPLLHRLGELLPRLSAPSSEALERRIEAFVTALERIATNRCGLLVAVGFSALGWLGQMGLLWLAFRGLGQAVPLSVLLFVVPIANIADIVPVPGGLGAIDTVFVILLVAATPVSAAVVTAAVLLFRTIIYVLPTVVGGSTVVLLSTRSAMPDIKRR